MFKRLISECIILWLFIIVTECRTLYVFGWEGFEEFDCTVNVFSLEASAVEIYVHSHPPTALKEKVTTINVQARTSYELLLHNFDAHAPFLVYEIFSATKFDAMVMVFTPTLILDVFHPLEVAKMGVVYVFPVDDVFYTVYMATPFFNVAAGVTIYYCDPNNTAALAKTLKAGYPQFYSLTSYRISAITLPKDNLDKPRKSSCRIEFNNQAAVFLAGSMRTAKGELRYPAEAILPVDLYATSWKSENLDNYASPSTYYMVSGSFGNVVKYVKSRESESQHELQEGDVLKVAIKGENYENLYVEISESTPTFLFLQYGGLTHISNAAWSNVFSLNLLFPFVSRRLQGTLGVIHYFSAFPEITSGYILKMDQVSLTSYKNVRVPAGKINVLLEANIKFGCVVFGKSNGSLVYYNSGLSPNSVFQDFDLKLLKPKQKNFIFRYVCPNQKYGINCLLNCECPDYHCNMNGTCYSSTCKIGTFGPKCQHEDLSIFSTAALLNQYFDHDDSSCKQTNSSIAISFPINFYVYTIHLVLQNALDPDSLVQAVYVENAETRQMVKVNYVIEVQESKEHTVVIWLDEVHWTRVIRIYLNNVSVCTVNIDGGVNLASQEHMLFTSKEFDKQQLDCLKDGDRYATCLTLEDNKKVEVELALRVTIRRLTVYSYDNRKQWLLQVTLLDKVKATQKKIVKESDEEVFITIDVVQEVTNIQLEAIQGTLSICEVEIYTDMWAPRSTTTTVSTQMMSQDGLNLSVTTPNDSSITTLSLETEATSEGSVFAFLLPTILTIYCLVHLAALLFVARKTGTKTTEVPIKQAEIVDSLDGIPSHFEVRSEDEVGADDWEKVIDEVAALEGYNEQDEVKTEEETGDVGDKSKWGQRSLEVQQP